MGEKPATEYSVLSTLYLLWPLGAAGGGSTLVPGCLTCSASPTPAYASLAVFAFSLQALQTEPQHR